ncbi:MAG: PQQ-binding-like beta-propeller repeat protein, partial [Acidimicrobiales bacterium]
MVERVPRQLALRLFVLLLAAIAMVSCARGGGASPGTGRGSSGGSPSLPPTSAPPPGASTTSVPSERPVAGGTLRRHWISSRLDGQVYAKPVVWKSLVLVATEDDSVYALSLATGRQVWSAHLASPAPAAALPCGDINPLGITSTPGLDRRTGRLFVLAETYVNSSVSHRLFALDASDGHVLWSERADPLGMTSPRDQQQRPALVISRGRVYVSYGGLYGDCGTYRGYVVGLQVSAPGAMITFSVAAANQAAIWSPSGPAVDAAGDLFV